MRKTILLLCLCAFIGCSKKENSTSNIPQGIQATAQQIGLKFEHSYEWHLIPYNGITGEPDGSNGYIVFHANGSITEYNLYIDTFTYKVEYFSSEINSTSILQSGISLKIFIPNYIWDTLSFGSFYNYAGGYNNDTVVMGTYLTSPIAQNDKPTLGGEFPIWKNKEFYLTP